MVTSFTWNISVPDVCILNLSFCFPCHLSLNRTTLPLSVSSFFFSFIIIFFFVFIIRQDSIHPQSVSYSVTKTHCYAVVIIFVFFFGRFFYTLSCRLLSFLSYILFLLYRYKDVWHNHPLDWLYLVCLLFIVNPLFPETMVDMFDDLLFRDLYL